MRSENLEDYYTTAHAGKFLPLQGIDLKNKTNLNGAQLG